MATLTVNFKVPLPPFDKRTWHDEYYEGMQILDAALAKYISLNQAQGLWQNATAYVVNDTVVDGDDGQLYECAVAHTSAASPTTFSADRTANPTYWVNVTLQERFRGAWATATAYKVGDFVTNGHQYAICIEAHTSGTFATDVTAEKWTLLIDATTSVNAAAASATAAAASAAGVNLPSIVAGDAGSRLQVNSAETGYEHVKDNLTATTSPGVGDDDVDGYAVGSRWFDTTADEMYICLDATTGAAVWLNTTLTLTDLGSIATQNSNSVTITGGTMSGVTITMTAGSISGVTRTEYSTFVIRGNVVDETLDVIKDIPVAATVKSVRSQSTSGTCTATFKINGVNLGGTANSVSSTSQSQSHSSANTMSAGDDLTVAISSNANCIDANFHIELEVAP